MSVYDKENLYLNFLTKIFQKSSSITRIYKTVKFPQIDRYIVRLLNISESDSVPEFGANMAQVTLWKFFSGVPKFDWEGENHVTEDELLNFMLNVV